MARMTPLRQPGVGHCRRLRRCWKSKKEVIYDPKATSLQQRFGFWHLIA